MGKIKSYTSYAIGEILLIVIGILVALQINNWNQGRIDRKAEIIFLNSLIEDMNQETFRLKRNFELGNLKLEAINSILYSLDNNLNSNIANRLDTALSICLMITSEKSISLSEYEIQGRLDKIRDESLKKQIIDYFKSSDELSKFENSMIGEFFRNDLLPFYYKNLNVNQGLSLLPDLPIWGKSKLWADQDVEVGNLYQTKSNDITLLNILSSKPIKIEMENLFSEYYLATEIANKSYPIMIENSENLINQCKKYINN